MSKRVAETTTASDSAVSSRSVDVDLTASCARIADAALIKLTITKHIGRFRIPITSNSESRTCMAEAASPSSHSSFCEEVFSRRSIEDRQSQTAATGDTNEVDRTNILAPGVWCLRGTHLLPAFTPEIFRGLAHWEVVSSYSSATAPDSHGISCADPLFQARKELDREVAACERRCKNFFAVIRLASRQTAGQVH